MRAVLVVFALSGTAVCGLAQGTAQEVVQGAMLYMRLANDTRSCVACHGPDPGQNPNNILRTADNPNTLAKVMNTVSAMGYLSSQLTEADRVNVTSFLGNIVRINDPAAALKIWPVTMDFGTVGVGQRSARQFVRVTNPSSLMAMAVPSVTVSGSPILVQNDCQASLPPGGACEIGLTLQPEAATLQRGAVILGSPALAQPLVVAFSGYGTTSPVSALAWQSQPTDLRFEAQAGGAQVQRTLTLSNPGPMPVVIGSTSITGQSSSQFRLLGGCVPGSVLQSGTQCELSVGFIPGAIAQSKAVLQLRSDHGNPPAIRLDGSSITDAPSPTPTDVLVSNSGGGCSMGPPGNHKIDPLLWLMTLLALGLHLSRGRSNRRRR